MTFGTQRSEIASRLRLDLNKSDQSTLVSRWLNQSQADIWSRYDWPWALEREIVQTVVDKTAGTVSVGAAGTTVTGVGTGFAASDVNAYIQFSSSNNWYRISAQASATSLTIESAYVSSVALSAGTYTIRRIFYATSSSVEKILSARQVVQEKKLEMVHFRDFDQADPHPTRTGTPTSIIPFGQDSSNNWRFTLYPFPDAVMNIEVRFKTAVVDLTADANTSEIPLKWRSTVMIDGAIYRGIQWISHGNPQPQDMRAEQMRRIFDEGIERMISDAEPESDIHHVISSRESRVAPRLPRLPNRYGA